MPELVEQMYCSEQIVIPPKFPYILKRYCKAAIKTQPYDLLRWSYEYFNSLAHHRPPPVKLRLEYPIFTTEGGLTRGCLKVIAQQLSSMSELPLTAVKDAWRGFCLDPEELARILCLCEVHLRSDSVPYLHFMAVAGGMLTKSITNTMILLCEALTKEPDGGSGAIPVKDFLDMYQFLAKMDASADVKYFNGYREGEAPETETQIEEETIQSESSEEEKKLREMSSAKLAQTTPADGMVAGRQMSTTSGEFVVQHVEKEIMDYIDDQIAILPDPDLKKKKAKPEEVAMVRGLVEVFIDDTMEILEPEEEEAEEEELPVPDVILVYAVPGIGAPIDNETIRTFTDYALDVCKVQNDLFMPRNIRHFMCPPLEKFDDVKYDIKHEKEEISTGGVFTV